MVNRSRQDDDYFVCAHCGAELAWTAKVCHACGASDDSGWNHDQAAASDQLDDDFDYDEFVQREFPEHAATPRKGSPKAWLTVIIVVLLCLALLAIW